MANTTGFVPWNKGLKQTDEQKLLRSVELVVSGKVFGYCEPEIRRHVKAYLIHTVGHICQKCGTKEWCGLPVPLVCDHIDGNSSNNELHNFRNVCCNCDAQLPTFKSKNRGKGRLYDREYKRSSGELARVD